MWRPSRSFLARACAYALIAGAAYGALTQVRPVRVVGESMHPTLHAGDLALVRTSARARVGDIVLVREAGRSAVLHRVAAEGGNGSLVLRGDANPIADLEPAPSSAVAGIVWRVVPVGGLLERWKGISACATLTAQPNSERR